MNTENIVFFYPENHQAHSEPDHPERPERVEAIVNQLRLAGIWDKYPKIAPLELPEALLHQIHHPDYLAQIRTASQAGRRLDMDTYITPDSWQLALNAAGGAAAVTQSVWDGDASRGFALSRPPGHHARPNQAMGFCLLNNIALAAQHILNIGAKRISIIDIDLHHGNGTQEIFYERDDVQFISIHQYSPVFYPGTGGIKETGSGPGKGRTTNIPFPPNAGDEARKSAMHEIILPMLSRHKPEMLLISAGFDAHWKDPLGHQLASAKGYGELVRSLCKWADEHCQGKIGLILEGGYDLEGGGASALAVTQALLGLEISDQIGPGTIREGTTWTTVITELKELWQINEGE